MDLHRYLDYKEYQEVQEKGNIKKLDRCWVRRDNIELLSIYLKEHIDPLKFGICHGTRRGKEQKWFRKYLDIEVIGTEISKTATEFPHTIQWDFHSTKKEWINNTDFIYSNSFDHSYKPVECLDTWMSCIKKTGICILVWSRGHKRKSSLDPFGATLAEYRKLITRRYHLKEEIRGHGPKRFFLIVSHKI